MTSGFYCLYAHGFVRRGCAVHNVTVADPAGNLAETLRLATGDDAAKAVKRALTPH